MERIISIATPYDCIVCGFEGSIVCGACKPIICPAVPSRCYICHASTQNYSTCHNCRRSSKLRRLYVRTEFSGAAKQLVYSLKFSNNQSAAEVVAYFMLQTLPKDFIALVTPVPTATSRLRLRGYDHARLISSKIAKALELEHVSVATRLNQTRQVGSRRSIRVSQLNDAYRLGNIAIIKGANILMVDDVVTTGATLESIAAQLKLAGAKSVDAVVFSQR